MPSSTPADLKPDLYESTSEIETPAVLVDLDVMERNLEEFATFAREHDVDLRSHVKTHKIPDLANKQTETTGGGIVCQTLGECEVMAQNGVTDVYLSYSVVEPRKLERLVWLSEKLDKFATTVDGPGNVDPLQRIAGERGVDVHVILEVNCGLDRTGVDMGEPAVEMARYIDEQSNLVLDGIMAYEAHVKYESENEAELEQGCLDLFDEVRETVDAIERAGIPVDEVKAGGTATSKYTGKHPVVTEVNPGMYPFNDTGEMKYRSWDVSKRDCAATVLSTVISTPTPDRAIVNAGSKSISMDTDRNPRAKHRDDVTYYNYSEEHGWIDTSESTEPIEVGDRLEFITPHVCTTFNLHDVLVGVRDGVVHDVWEVQARGKVK